MSFIYGRGQYYPQIEISSITQDYVEFYLRNVDLSFANTLRRVIISEVPTMAIDRVLVKENTSPLFDEFIVHRLGLLPLKSTNMDQYNFSRKCNCDQGCSKCEVYYQLKVEYQESRAKNGVMDVTTDDIIPENENCEIVPVKYDDPIVICKIAKNQQIIMDLIAKKGTGKMHSKWSPVATCIMREIPSIQIVKEDNKNKLFDNLTIKQKDIFVKSCPSNIFYIDQKNNEIKIQNSEKCSFCEECTTKVKEFIKKNNTMNILSYKEVLKVEPKKGEYFFRVESVGGMKPEDIVKEAFKIMIEKFNELDSLLANI